MINLLKEVTKLKNIISIFSFSCYNVLKYKCCFVEFEDAVISMCEYFIQKNYIFTKVIQWGIQEIYDHADVKNNVKNNDKLKNYFSTFSNNVPYTHDELQYSNLLIKNVIQCAKLQNGDELVIENEDENGYVPMNSGSVALVFKAQLNNLPVVIKILRPNIRNKIKEDVDVLLHFFDNIMIKSLVNYYIKINFKTFITSNVEILLNQCDFMNEVTNATVFKDHFKNKKNIIIPNFYTHFTEMFHEVIVMEYLDGPIAKNVPLERLNHYLEPLQSFFFDSLYRYKILHGDFHLGNIIIMNNGNSIGIIDFGIVYYLTDEISNNLFDIMFLSLETNNIKNVYKILKIAIGMNCLNKCQHEFVFKMLKEDKTIIELSRHEFSANVLIKVINKITSLENVDLVPDVCKLFLSTMSGLQTIEYTNSNKPLGTLLRVYMNKTIMIE